MGNSVRRLKVRAEDLQGVFPDLVYPMEEIEYLGKSAYSTIRFLKNNRDYNDPHAARIDLESLMPQNQ